VDGRHPKSFTEADLAALQNEGLEWVRAASSTSPMERQKRVDLSLSVRSLNKVAGPTTPFGLVPLSASETLHLGTYAGFFGSH
jgi:hypothetical protein